MKSVVLSQVRVMGNRFSFWRSFILRGVSISPVFVWSGCVAFGRLIKDYLHLVRFGSLQEAEFGNMRFSKSLNRLFIWRRLLIKGFLVLL